MTRKLLSIFTFLFCFASLNAQKSVKGHNIRVKLENYPEKELILGFYYGDKQFVKDTVNADADGYFSFKADTMLACGVYLFVLKPDNAFIQLLVPENDQQFSMTTDAKDPVGKMKVKDSEDNALFYDYMQMLNKLRPEADTLRAKIARTNIPEDSIKMTRQIEDMDKRVKKYQNDLIVKHPETWTAKIIKASFEPEPPVFTGGTEMENNKRKYYWYKAHFFDNIDIADPCMLRGPVLHAKIEQYVTKLTPQHPDSICQSIDLIIGKLASSPESYKFYLIHFLNYYAKSTIVGMDGVYVHIAKKYYCTGQATWAKKEDLEKICDNASRLEPILIGKIAPNITVKDRQNQPHALWDVDADYTVLFFWDPECGHCKKAAPDMVKFAEKWKPRGVRVFAVCTALTDKAESCWESAKEKEFSDEYFLNMYDPYIQSKYKTLYDVKSTPQIFILDRKHEILMKRIGAEQLDSVMEEVIKFQKSK